MMLKAEFQDGAERIYDVKPLMEKIPVFKMLGYVHGLFEQVRVDTGGYGIVWNDEIDLECNELYENGRQVLMKDVQKEFDPRNIQIDRVGVRNVNYPITALYHDGGTQSTIARISMSVMLPREYRGTHMSRFIETLEDYRGRVSPHNLEDFTRSLCEKLNASESSVRFRFPYYFRKKAPVSGIESFSKCDIDLQAHYSKGKHFDMIIGVALDVQTLCPCSKEISKYGAHNQRALVSLNVRCKALVWFEELIDMIEASASSPLYTLLKREDEKFITEHSYENPRFVEDVIRELAVRLDSEDRITWYKAGVESQESIHEHNAFAEIEREK